MAMEGTARRWGFSMSRRIKLEPVRRV